MRKERIICSLRINVMIIKDITSTYTHKYDDVCVDFFFVFFCVEFHDVSLKEWSDM